MCQKFTPDELNKMDHERKNVVICQMQKRLDKLEHDYENLIGQIRLANQQKFGRSTEKLSEIAGQLSFFNEPEALCDETAEELDINEVIDENLNAAALEAKGIQADKIHRYGFAFEGKSVLIG